MGKMEIQIQKKKIELHAYIYIIKLAANHVHIEPKNCIKLLNQITPIYSSVGNK